MAEREIKTVLTLEDASFSKGLKAATSNVSAIRAEMQAAVAGTSGLGKGMKQWKAQVTGLSSALKSQKQQMSLLNRQYTEQKKKLADAEKALKDAKKANGENSEEVKKAANAYAYESTQVDELRVKMARLSTQMSQDKAMLNQRLTQPLKMAASAAKTFGIVVGTSMLAAGTALVALGKKSLDARQQLNADLSASQATFEVWSNFIEKDAKNAWKNLGLSTDAYLQHAVSMGEYLQAAGLPVQQSAALTSELMQRAADLAGVYGTSTDDALGAIEKAAQGSYREMKRYGLSLNSASVEQWALDKGLIQVGESLSTEQERAYAVQMILDKTSSAAEGFATRTDNVNAALETASAAWQNFIDGTGSADSVVAAFSQAAGAVAKEVENLTPELVAGIKALILAFVDNLPGLLTELSPALETLLTGILDTLTGNSEDIGEAAGTLLGNLAGSLIANIPTLISSAAKVAKGFLTGFKNSAKITWEKRIWPALQDVFKITFGVELPDWDKVRSDLKTTWEDAKRLAYNIRDNIETGKKIAEASFDETFKVVFGVDLPSIESIQQFLHDWFVEKGDQLAGIIKTTLGIDFPTLSEIEEKWNVFWESVYHLLPPWLKDVMSFFGIGGGEAQSGETALNAAANALADTVTDASASIRGLSGAAQYATTGFYASANAHISSGTVVTTDPTGAAHKINTPGGISDQIMADLARSLSSYIEREQFGDALRQIKNLPETLLSSYLSSDVLDMLKNGSTVPDRLLVSTIKTTLDQALGLEQTSQEMQQSMDAASDSAVQIAASMAEASAAAAGILNGTDGSHAGGSWNVPFDNYIARLHAGEMVLTADQARRYRAQAAAGNTYNDSASIYIEKYNQYSGADADALLAQMQAMQRRRRMGYGLA